MSRVLCFVRSPVALTFIGLYCGTTSLDEVRRKDLDRFWSKTPPTLVMMAIGGKEALAMLRKGVEEFDTFFEYKPCVPDKDYTIDDMERAIAKINMCLEAEKGVEDFFFRAAIDEPPPPPPPTQNTTPTPTASPWDSREGFVLFFQKHKRLLTGGAAGALCLVVVLYFFVFKNYSNSVGSKKRHLLC